MVERLNGIQKVRSSILLCSTNIKVWWFHQTLIFVEHHSLRGERGSEKLTKTLDQIIDYNSKIVYFYTTKP